MEKNKDTKRIDFHTNDLVSILKIFDKLHMDIVILQEELMKCQTSLFHEKWKYRHVSRTLKELAKKLGRPDLAMSEEELDAQIRKSEN
jgi:hypothetical protein